MSNFTYDGDIKSVTEPQLNFISEVLQKMGFTGSKVTIEPVGQAGDNFIASVKRVIITENGEAFKMIAKCAPENKNMREEASIDRVFRNEHIMYTEVFPKFDQMQKSAGVPKDEQIQFAKYYGSLDKAPNEVILLEDLKEHNFGILSRFEALSCQNVKLVLKKYAMFHALSYATRYREPETYAVFQKLLAHNLDFDAWGDESNEFTNMIESQALEVTDSRCEKVIKGSLTRVGKSDAKIRKLSRDSKHCVIQHGDAWTNNIMFRVEDNAAVECMLIDFHEAQEKSPVYDLMYLLFISTTHEQRSLHFHDYLDYYHNQLDIALNYFNLKANFVYPKDRLDADMKLYGKLMFGTCLLIASFVTMKPEEVEQMNEVMELKNGPNGDDDTNTTEVYKLKNSESIDLLRIKIEGLVDSFVEFGLL